MTCNFCQQPTKRRLFCSDYCKAQYHYTKSFKGDKLKVAKARLYNILRNEKEELSDIDSRLLIILEGYYEDADSPLKPKGKGVLMLDEFNEEDFLKGR